MPISSVHNDSIVIAPQSQRLVLPSRNKKLSIFSNSQSIESSFLTPIAHSDSLSIKAVSIRYFPIAPTTYNRLLVRTYLDFGYRPRVPISSVHNDSIVIAPQSQRLVLPSRNKKLSIFSNSQSIESSFLTPIAHSDSLSIKAVSIRYFPIAPASQQLTFIRMITHLLEHRGLKKTCQSDVVFDVSHDARPIARC